MGKRTFFQNALFPLRGDNEINFLRKKLRGLGYSVLRKQNTAIPQLWRSPAKDLFRHSAKKREDETKISPKNSLTHPATDTHAPASHRTGSYPAPGIQGGGVSPLVIKNQSAFSTQPKNLNSRIAK